MPDTPFYEVRNSRGRLLFKFAPELDIIELKDGELLVEVSLRPYRDQYERACNRTPAPVVIPIEIASQA